MPDSPEGLRREIDRLRDWRHELDKLLPLLSNRLDSLGGRTAALERRLTAIEDSVKQMATAEQNAEAVARAFREGRASIFSRGTKIAAAIGGSLTVLAAIGSFALAVYLALHG